MTKIVVATAKPEASRRWQEVIQTALPHYEVVAWETGGSSIGARYAVVWSPPDSLFQTETELEAIFNLGAGVDAILALPSLPDIPVYRLEDAGMAPQMAEYVIHYLSGISRGFDIYAKQQQAGAWSPLKTTRYEDWPVGVMGVGKLGLYVAKAIAALGYPVAGWARSPRDEEDVQIFHGKEQFAEFLGRTRVLVNLLPLTPETAGIINGKLLAGLQHDSVVINIARGGHIVDEDLIDALNSGHVRAAVLDVFNQEPLPREHPYWNHPRVRVTPHVAAMTLEADAVMQISRRIELLERGEPASGLVHRDTGY